MGVKGLSGTLDVNFFSLQSPISEPVRGRKKKPMSLSTPLSQALLPDDEDEGIVPTVKR